MGKLCLPGCSVARGRLIRALAAVTAVVATAGAHAQVYKCPGANGAMEFTDKPCTAEAVPIKTRDTSFGGSGRSAEIALQGRSCLSTATGRYTTAAGMVVNNTTEPRRVAVTATFSNRGQVVDTATQHVDLPAFGRAPFSIVGGPGAINHCEYQWRWD